MQCYVSLFERSEVRSIVRYGPDTPDFEDKVIHPAFTLNGQQFMCIDSNIQREWTFMPAIPLDMGCESEEEVERLYERLSEGSEVFMPLGTYPFSEKYVWQVVDTASVYLLADAERAGRGILILVVDNLETGLAEIAGRGIEPGAIEEITGVGRKSVISDPDGNTVSIIEVFTNRRD